MLVKYVSGEASVGAKHLARHGPAHRVVLFCDEPNMVS